MKKTAFILIAVLAISGVTFAQDKPAKGSFGTEVQFNPFDQDGKTFKLDGLKFRYFLTDKDAIRLKIGVYTNNGKLTDSDSEEQQNGIYSYENEYKYSTGDFKLDLGYERHFDLNKRMSVYVGASIGFTRHFASTTIEGSGTYEESHRSSYTSSFKGEIKNGAIIPSGDFDGSVDMEDMLDKVNDRAYLGVNAAIFTGLDFYVYKGLYVGTELGLSLKTQGTEKMKYDGEVIDENGFRDLFNEESTDKFRQTECKVYIEPVLRLGWTF